MTHLYYGDPCCEFSDKLAKTLLDSGADILEVGIPYTDPVCDGEIFQRACKRALEKGITPFDVFDGIKKLTLNRACSGSGQATYLTSYYAPIYKIGIRKFVKKAKEAGVRGLIVPDLLLEEQGEFRKACESNGLSLIQFATVYSSRERLRQIIKASTDFIYCISLPGVTGDKTAFSKLAKLLRLLKSMTEKPIYVGFGIKSAEEARKIIHLGADGIIVGSAIARIYEKYPDNPEKSFAEISTFIKSLKESKIKESL